MITETRDSFRARLSRSRFALLLDGTVAAVLLLAASVFLFGGFREYFGSIRLSVRSADRLLLLATLLIVVRHALVPRPSIVVSLQRLVERVRASEAVQAVWPAFVATRATVLLVGYFAVVTIGPVAGSERFRVSEDPVGNLLARWDTQWYLSIAQQGYQWNGDPRIEQNVVFFPAFPAAMRIVGPFVGRDWLLAGLLLALAAFFLALLYLFRLARQMMSADRARHAVWLVATYPFAVYYSAAYTEGFYLLGAVATFFHLGRAEWWRAAGWGCFLALCRPNGFFIALPAAIVVAQHAWKERRLTWAAVAACVAPGIGVLAYSLYLYALFADGLVWMKGQQAWGRVFVGVGPSLYALFFDRFNVIRAEGFTYYTSTNPYDFIYTCTAIFVLASLWPCARRFGWAYAVFVAVNIVPPLLMGGMMSIGRMTSVLFPAFLWIAAGLGERQLLAWIVGSAILQGLVAALFFTWRPIF
jgi:hypothetical protein